MPSATWAPVEAKSHLDKDAHHHLSVINWLKISTQLTLHPDECEYYLYPCTLEPSYYTPLGMSICTTKALRMKPPVPQSWVATTQLTVDPTPSQACSQECLPAQYTATSTDRPMQYKSSSSFLSLAPENSAAAGRKGSRAAEAKHPTSHKVRPCC